MDYYIEFPKLGWRFEVGRVAFEITDSISVKWYGVIICAALLLCVFLGFRCCEKYCMSKDDLMDFILITVPSAIVGARLYFVIFSWDLYKDGDFGYLVSNRLTCGGHHSAVSPLSFSRYNLFSSLLLQVPQFLYSEFYF